MDKETSFPVYRKYQNNSSYFRIDSAINFTEIQIFGSRKTVYNLVANQYPEKLRIMDMIQLEAPFVACSQEEFDQYI